MNIEYEIFELEDEIDMLSDRRVYLEGLNYAGEIDHEYLYEQLDLLDFKLEGLYEKLDSLYQERAI